MRTVKLHDTTLIPQLGQGTWNMGESTARYDSEVEALRWGIDHGMTLIDTAEMYGDGAAEELVGDAIRPYNRNDLFLVSKVYPWNAGRKNIFRSCEDSLERMGTDHLDLYLLHWRGSVPLAETVECMEELKQQGKILRWGVSNFDTADMKELLSVRNGDQCQVNQVLYHLGSRGVEYDLLPFMNEHGIPMMAYCPLAQAGRLKQKLLSSRVLQEIAEAKGRTVMQILLAFTLLRDDVIPIPKASSVAHTSANRDAAEIILTQEECDLLDREFPKPDRKVPLDME
ncbi:MAG: aldo/keto reductase [Erysipelotrichaceae bacterium]|nr:aldo/keto reductase [Erysipelotrichaceae bacterium]